MEIFDVGDEKRYIRSFVGIPLPMRFKKEFAELLTDCVSIDPELKLADEETPHILLYFLGNQFGKTLKIVADEISVPIRAFRNVEIETGGAEHFVGGKREVIFLKMEGFAPIDSEINSIREILKKYNRDNKSFSPHLTVARKDVSDNAVAVLKDRLDKISWRFAISEVVIYGGETGKTGIEQRVLIRLPTENG